VQGFDLAVQSDDKSVDQRSSRRHAAALALQIERRIHRTEMRRQRLNSCPEAITAAESITNKGRREVRLKSAPMVERCSSATQCRSP
jgi:hypothetical protein